VPPDCRRWRPLPGRGGLEPAGALLFRAFSNLSQSLGKPHLVSWLQVVSLAVKVPLSVG
jgi:MATE family multidrug resistance protein